MNKKKRALVAALVVSGIAVVGLAAVVYAKYLSEITRTGTATVAKWAFETDNSATGTVTCDPTSTIVSGTIANGMIAPGTSGTCTIVLSNANSDVSVNYTVTVDEASSTIPTNMKLNNSAIGSFSATGTIAIGGSATVTINWEWPYETGTPVDGVAPGDEDDTDDGKAAVTDSSMSIVFKVKGVQTDPRS